MNIKLAVYKAAFEDYVDRFELHQYKLRFQVKEDGENDSTIKTDSQNCCADVTLSNLELSNDQIVASAKHEAVHLLVGRLSEIGESRFATHDEYMAAEEELVRKLCFLIPDIEIKEGGKS